MLYGDHIDVLDSINLTKYNLAVSILIFEDGLFFRILSTRRKGRDLRLAEE